eukprot:gene14062-15527_t
MSEPLSEGELANAKEFVANYVEDHKQVDEAFVVPVRPNCFCMTEEESKGEAIDLVFAYLSRRNCNSPLKSALANAVASKLKVEDLVHCRLEDHTSTSAEEDTTHKQYDAMKVAKYVFDYLLETCKEWTDEMPSLFKNKYSYIVSVNSIKNKRRKMEDKHVVLTDFNILHGFDKGAQSQAFFTVLDGHGGIDAACYAASQLHCNLKGFEKLCQQPIEALRYAFTKTDADFVHKAKKERLKSGSTGVAVLIQNDMMNIGWVGDSQVILAQNGTAITLMDPHKPDREDEKQRIEELGGCVVWFGGWRVNGSLAVSRAIGDYEQKPFVSADADIAQHVLTDEDDYIILACDGLWDVVEPSTAVQRIDNYLIEGNDKSDAAKMLVDEAKSRGSMDNITVVVVFLDGHKQSRICRIAHLTTQADIIKSKDQLRNLEYFCGSLHNLVSSTEPCEGGGELTVKLPKEAAPLVAAGRFIRISIEFVLDRPKGGVKFVVPSGDGSLVQRNAHVFTCTHGNSSRLWFPCVDSFNDVCTWKMDFTVDKDMIAVGPGDLQDKVFTQDEKKVTYRYILTTPTSAPNIGFAIGPFEMYIDPNMSDVTNFCLIGLLPLLKHSVSLVSEAFDFYEENLNTRYPYNLYKQVFVDEADASFQTFASLSLFDTNLLHSSRIIDQTILTRTAIAHALSEQFFGCFVVMSSWIDYWLPLGISGYICGLLIKKIFGNNFYRYWIQQEMDQLCSFELDGAGLPALFPFPLTAADLRQGSDAPSVKLSQQTTFSDVAKHHPHLVSPKQMSMLKTKSHLVLRMVDLRIGQDLLLQALNKVLSLATTASAASHSEHMAWSNLLISTTGFLKTISSVSGKDINNIMDQWGPLIVSIQELDGSFTHTVQVEDITSHHELPCHSKSRRNKKKKIPLVTGEEVDMDLNQTVDSDSPVLWLRIDPDMTWARQVFLQQPDYMWQYQLKYERDITSQIEAVKALSKYPSSQCKTCLLDIISQVECFYKVRVSASECLVKILSSEQDSWDAPDLLINCFQKLFGAATCPSFTKYNDFSNLISYFIQKELPVNISKFRNINGQCPFKILRFVLDTLKYNDNQYNKLSDGDYRSSLIDALANTITPALTMVANDNSVEGQVIPAQEEAQLILAEVVRNLNLEKLLPTYKYAVTKSCLRVIRALQVNGHIPAESAIFKTYARHGEFKEVRFVAIECLVDFIRVECNEQAFKWLLDCAIEDPLSAVRSHIIKSLSENPPFTRRSGTSLNVPWLVERLWQLMNSECASNSHLLCQTIDLYNTLYGRVTPSCVPSQGFGVVIDLRERKAISNISPIPPPGSPDIQANFEDNQSKKSLKRKLTKLSISPTPDSVDSVPGTPLNMESSLATGSKLKLKIKLGVDDASGPESGGEQQHKQSITPSLNPMNLTEEQLAKKFKKKKKKKHKHKDRKDKDRLMDLDKNRSTDGSVPPSPYDSLM